MVQERENKPEEKNCQHNKVDRKNNLLIDQFSSKKPLVLARRIIALNKQVQNLSSKERKNFKKELKNIIDEFKLKNSEYAEAANKILKFLKSGSIQRANQIALLKEYVRKNTPVYPLTTYGLSQNDEGIKYYESSEKHALKLSAILGQARGGESGRVAMGAFIQAMRDFLGDAEYSLSEQERADAKGLLGLYEECFFGGNIVFNGDIAREVALYENTSLAKNKQVPTKVLPQLKMTQEKLLKAFMAEAGTKHLFQISTNNHALLMEINHVPNQNGGKETFLSIFDSGGRWHLDRNKAYLTPEERGKVSQERKINISALIAECLNPEKELSFDKIIQDFLELNDQVYFRKNSENEPVVQSRQLSHFEKIFDRETINQRMTNEITRIIPYHLKNQCPDVVDENTVLRRPQKLGDCQIDVLLSHLSNRCQENSTYLKFKSHLLKEAKANLENASLGDIKSILKNDLISDISFSDYLGSRPFNETDTLLAKFYNKINSQLREISWMRNSSDPEMDKRYMEKLENILQKSIEDFDRIPDEAILAFKDFALSSLDKRIEKNEQRINVNKSKTKLFLPKTEAIVLAHGKQRQRDNTFPSVNRSYIKYLSAQLVPGVNFNDSKIPYFVSDGCCSAMSLTFAKQFKEVKRGLKKDILDSKLRTTQALEALAQDAKYSGATSKMVSIQALFNTIEVTDQSLNDPKRSKMSLLASVSGLMVTGASDEVDLSQRRSMKKLEELLENLPEGTHALRMLNDDASQFDAENKKAENHGHTMTVIKNKDAFYFYDPNYGIRQLDKKNLLSNIKSVYEAFDVPKARFYQLKDLDKSSQIESLKPDEMYRSKVDSAVNTLNLLSSKPIDTEEKISVIKSAFELHAETLVVNNLIVEDNKNLAKEDKLTYIKSDTLKNAIHGALNTIIADIADDHEQLTAVNEEKDKAFGYLYFSGNSKPVKGGYYDLSYETKLQLIERLEAFNHADAKDYVSLLDEMMTLFKQKHAGIHSIELQHSDKLFNQRKAAIACCQLLFPHLMSGSSHELNRVLDLLTTLKDIEKVTKAIEKSDLLTFKPIDYSNYYANQFDYRKLKKWLIENQLYEAQ